MKINWQEEVASRKEELLQDLQQFLQIESVLDEATIAENAPFGKGIAEALNYMLDKGNKDGFIVKNVDGYAGHIEMGAGAELVGILCHVDVVPAGEGWIHPPFSGVIQDGKIYARGAIDDKGPTLAAYYGMKIVKELGLPLSKRVRMILGTDEESNWQCVDYYFKHEEMPTIGFAPDADFPIIHAEKGILDVALVMKGKSDVLVRFVAGQRVNMVPDVATAVLQSTDTSIISTFNDFLIAEELTGKCWLEAGQMHVKVYGIAAHGSEPSLGRNAGVELAKFLTTVTLDDGGRKFVTFLANHLADSTGLDIACQDEVSGSLTLNAGVLTYDGEKGHFAVNIRYPVTVDVAGIVEKIHKVEGVTVVNISDLPSHYVEKNHPLVTTLQKVYEEQTGEPADLLAIGGGTYARALEAGVAFGALFPGEPDVAHQKDEYINVESLLKATAIYAQAIFELAK